MKPKTRIGKIARLPLAIRDQLNHRLQNGEMGGPILRWLNALPETIRVLAELFQSMPINKQNLSDWRHGGYQDWLNHQDREKSISRVCEQGHQLETAEGPEDLFDCFGRIVIAEMADDLENLHDMTDRAERSKRLHLIARDLARLQNSFNHSKRVELEWVKRNDQYEEEDSGTGILPVRTEPEHGQDARPAGSRRGDEADSLSHPQTQTVKPSQPESTGAAISPTPPRNPISKTVIRCIYHCRCSRGCICKNCHPDNGEYPYAQAVKDSVAKQMGVTGDYWKRGNLFLWVDHVDCDCDCNCEKLRSAGLQPANPPANFMQSPCDQFNIS